MYNKGIQVQVYDFVTRDDIIESLKQKDVRLQITYLLLSV